MSTIYTLKSWEPAGEARSVHAYGDYCDRDGQGNTPFIHLELEGVGAEITFQTPDGNYLTFDASNASVHLKLPLDIAEKLDCWPGDYTPKWVASLNNKMTGK
jgi:hypothetical protein